MKKITTILLIMISVFSIAEAKKDKTITVYHTNDTHSQIYPYSPNLSDTTKAGRGGFVRRVAFFDLQRKQNPDLLLFDSGDFSQGSPYFTMYKGDVEVGLMNLMGYDAVAIGNHEFDFGLENMARLFRNARFAVVCANRRNRQAIYRHRAQRCQNRCLRAITTSGGTHHSSQLWQH